MDKILRGLVSVTLEYLDLLTQIQGEGQGVYRRHDNIGNKCRQGRAPTASGDFPLLTIVSSLGNMGVPIEGW